MLQEQMQNEQRKINTDCFFTKGDSHRICQDYCTTFENENIATVVCCDGCSSSQKVDIGARLLAEIFVKSISFIDVRNAEVGWENRVYDDVRQWVAFRVGQARDLIGLEPSAFDATLLAAVYVKSQKKVLIFQWGDGVITKAYSHPHPDLKEKGGIRLQREWITYSDNAPDYFSYRVWPDRGAEYRRYFEEQKAILHVNNGLPNEEGSFITWLHGLRMTTEDLRQSGNGELKWIHLSSDGVDSFQDVNEKSIPDMAVQFTDFKSMDGEFVQRRMNRMLRNLRKEGSGHYDDLGVAAISFS